MNKTLKKSLIIAFWLIIWEGSDRIVNNHIILAGPVRILESLAGQIRQSDFWVICGASVLRITAGFLLAFAAGILIGVLAYRVIFVREMLEPVMTMLKTVPMISIVIMLLIWAGNQTLTIYLSFLIVFPLIYTSTLTGFENVDPEMLEMADVFSLSRSKKFLYIYRPALMPFLISSCKVSLGLSWKSGIMAEVIATPRPSIGREMFQAKSYLATADLLAWTVVVILLSFVFEKLLLKLIEQFDIKRPALPAQKEAV